MESQIISNKTIADPEVTYDDDTTSNKSTKLPQLLVQGAATTTTETPGSDHSGGPGDLSRSIMNDLDDRTSKTLPRSSHDSSPSHYDMSKTLPRSQRSSPCRDYYSDEDFDLRGPPSGKRLAPVGAASNEDEDMASCQETGPGGALAGGGRGAGGIAGVSGGSLGGPLHTALSADGSAHFGAYGGGGLGLHGGHGGRSEANHELEERVRQMEEDQDELNTSLMSLTSHFAKVQLRLQQVVGAAPEKREDLLRELEQFAFRGIPNLSPKCVTGQPDLVDEEAIPPKSSSIKPEIEENSKEQECYSTNDTILETQKKRQAELIHQLKGQLEELESYAYASGEGTMPSNVLLDRQRVVMEQLKARLNLNVDNIDKLSEDELKAQVDSAVGQIVNPLKMKSQLVDQLQTQITDLEMFIDFLQGEASTIIPGECDGCGCSKHNSPTKSPNHQSSPNSKSGKIKNGKHHHHNHGHGVPRYKMRTKEEQEEIRKKTTSILEKTIALLQLTALAQFGCGGASEHFHKNSLKQTTKGNHYGDLRARLEMAVDHILEACSRIECLTDTDCTTTSNSSSIASDELAASSSAAASEAVPNQYTQPEFLMTSPLVTTIVRRELAVAIRDLMQHGMIPVGGRGSFIPFMGCMSARSGHQNKAKNSPTSASNTCHAWDVIIKYYKMKGGPEYNSAPARKLSMSFGLDLSGGGSTGNNNRQALLAVINQIIVTHEPYKRSPDAMFKAFICSGLNKRKLIPWLKVILRNQTILETFYTNWSYVVKSGFDDAFRAIERLSMYVFDLPVDVAVKQFKDMNEAF